jgi:ABC-type multidrug transport system ATPase subunit
VRPAGALDFIGVTKSYGDIAAVGPVTLSVDAGRRTVMIGHNGSGKTTLLKIAAGLLEASDGEVLVGGEPAGSLPARAALSFISDSPTFYEDLTLWEHLEYVARLHGNSDWEQHAADLLGHLGLYDRADDMPHRFSRGLRQKSAIALGFVRPFEVLVVDEPFVGLDFAGKEAFIQLVDQAVAAGAAAVVATHELDFAEGADRLVALRDGSLVHDGPGDGLDVRTLVSNEDPAGERDGEAH